MKDVIIILVDKMVEYHREINLLQAPSMHEEDRLEVEALKRKIHNIELAIMKLQMVSIF